MRILLISHTAQSRTGGQPRAELLAQMPDVELCLLVPDRWYRFEQWYSPQTPVSDNFDWEVGKVLWPWSGPGQWYFHWYPKLAAVLKKYQPDIIDLWEEPYGLVSAHTCWLRNRMLPHAKIVAETEQNINKFLPPPFSQFRSYTLNNTDFAIGRNDAAIEVLRANGYQGPAEVVPNAVDAELFRPMDREACRREFGVSGFTVGYVGRLVEEKGLMDMVNALSYCSPEVNLLFAGSGPFQADLEQRARELGKASQVRFLPNRPLAEVPQLMNALDIFVLASHTTPSWKEQFGRVIIEAHACRVPVIGSDSGAIPAVIGRAGIVVPERNPQALAEAITSLQQNPEHLRQLGEQGRRQVEEDYTWSCIASRMHQIYQRVLEPQTAPQPGTVLNTVS